MLKAAFQAVEDEPRQAFRVLRLMLEGNGYNQHTYDGNYNTTSTGQPVQPTRVLLALERTLQVVMINLDEADDAYLVFESLNSKGEP